MEMSQNVANQNTTTANVNVDSGRDYENLTTEQLAALSPRQDMFIDFMAFAAFTTGPDGTPQRMTDEDIAAKLGVNRRTLTRWRQSIPDYNQLISKRRHEKFKREIEDGVWRGLILKAMAGNPKQAEMVLSHFGDYVPPTQNIKHGISESLADVMTGVGQSRKVVEGEVTDVTPNSNMDAQTGISAPVNHVTPTIQPAQPVPERSVNVTQKSDPQGVAVGQNAATTIIQQPPQAPQLIDDFI